MGGDNNILKNNESEWEVITNPPNECDTIVHLPASQNDVYFKSRETEPPKLTLTPLPLPIDNAANLPVLESTESDESIERTGCCIDKRFFAQLCLIFLRGTTIDPDKMLSPSENVERVKSCLKLWIVSDDTNVESTGSNTGSHKLCCLKTSIFAETCLGLFQDDDHEKSIESAKCFLRCFV